MNGDPEELVGQIQSRPQMPTLQKGELLPKREELPDEIPAASKEG
jgi:hypothetical protein